MPGAKTTSRIKPRALRLFWRSVCRLRVLLARHTSPTPPRSKRRVVTTRRSWSFSARTHRASMIRILSRVRGCTKSIMAAMYQHGLLTGIMVIMIKQLTFISLSNFKQWSNLRPPSKANPSINTWKMMIYSFPSQAKPKSGVLPRNSPSPSLRLTATSRPSTASCTIQPTSRRGQRANALLKRNGSTLTWPLSPPVINFKSDNAFVHAISLAPSTMRSHRASWSWRFRALRGNMMSSCRRWWSQPQTRSLFPVFVIHTMTLLILMRHFLTRMPCACPSFPFHRAIALLTFYICWRNALKYRNGACRGWWPGGMAMIKIRHGRMAQWPWSIHLFPISLKEMVKLSAQSE